MDRNPLAIKWLHTGLLTLYVGVVIFGLPTLPVGWMAWLSLGPVVFWVLGQRYEHHIIADSGIATREELKQVEWRSGSIWSMD